MFSCRVPWAVGWRDLRCCGSSCLRNNVRRAVRIRRRSADNRRGRASSKRTSHRYPNPITLLYNLLERYVPCRLLPNNTIISNCSVRRAWKGGRTGQTSLTHFWNAVVHPMSAHRQGRSASAIPHWQEGQLDGWREYIGRGRTRGCVTCLTQARY
jgi:hypothetical protein